ncbi:MAG: hypothetical protein HDS41_07325 [Bacteroides sp.]|nr:hypothetical protein [Bacteroides sp.]
MKKYIILIILSASMLTACHSAKLTSATDDNKRHEISWNAFCDARGYDRSDNTYATVNEYLDTWCGSAEEENAFIKAHVKPY